MSTYYLWLDMETTGLDLNTDVPLEVAWAVTNADLELVVEPRSLLVEQVPVSIRDPFVLKMHAENGLWAAYQAGPRWHRHAVRREIISDLRSLPEGSTKHLAGSGVHFDKAMLEKHFPAVPPFLHYRLVDVSVVGRFLQEVCGLNPPSHTTAHRALDDVLLSIERAREYRKMLA